MVKKDLINEVCKQEYKDVCKKLLPSLADDLYQELNLIILDYDESRLLEMEGYNQKYFIIGILLNMVKSTTSPFYKKYRDRVTFELIGNNNGVVKDFIETIADSSDYNHETDGEINTIEQTIDNSHYFDRHVFNQYLHMGTLRAVAKEENISVWATRQAVNNVKENIKRKMKPIRILLITVEGEDGLKYHRQRAPHARLAKLYDEFKVSILSGRTEDGRKMESSIDELTDEQLSQYDIIYYLRQISFRRGRVKETLERLKRLGIKTILDIDDYWKLNSSHLMYQQYKALNIQGETEEALRLVDHVITTTDYFANEIKPFNPNVTVLPNCINPDDEQFKPRAIQNSRVRFGWIGGVYHRDDLVMISENFCKIADDRELKDKYQICLGGYNVQYTKDSIIINKEYNEIEKAMTCNYEFRNYDATYTNYLFSYTNTSEHISYDKPYRRLWGKDVFHYGELYNDIDVALVPLVPNKFNKCKSELKIIEAGAMGKAVIVSDTEPYAKWIKNGVNGIKINPNRNSIDWYLAMKKLTLNPQMIVDMAGELQKTIKENFDIDKHTAVRAELYKTLV